MKREQLATEIAEEVLESDDVMVIVPRTGHGAREKLIAIILKALTKAKAKA